MSDGKIATFKPAGDELIEEYKKGGRNYHVTTRPYWSVITVVGTVVDIIGGTAAHVIIERNQRMRCFDYAVGGQRDDGFGGQIRASYADTNLSKPRQTNSTEDFCIQNVRVSVQRARLLFARVPTGVTTPLVVSAYQGRVSMLDVGAVVRPPQFDSPLRLEDSLGRLIRPILSLNFLWDGEQNTKVGLMSQCPDQQGASLLTAAGLPTESNEFEMPEGAVWRKSGKENDTELNMECATEADAVFVINGVQWPGDTANTFPTKVAIDILVELGGFAAKYPSQN